MLRLKHVHMSPQGGFGFQDLATGWRTHSWSFRGCWGDWYKENQRRRTGKTQEDCAREIEQYMCEQLMKVSGWQQWVMVVADPVFTLPNPPEEPTIVEANVAVIIPVYRRTDRLWGCVNAVKDQVNEMVIVCGETETFDVNPKIKLVNCPTNSFSAKCNLGAKNCGSEYLWFLNDDCYPSPTCAAKLMGVLESNKRVGAVGHLLRYPDGRVQHGGTVRATAGVGFAHIKDDSVKEPVEMESVTGASMLVRREAFDDVGGFSEEYPMYLEDTDLCLRLRQEGWKVIYTPHSEAIHEEGASSNTRPDIQDLIARSVEVFKRRSAAYYADYPAPPHLESLTTITPKISIDVAYTTLAGDPKHEELAKRFVDSALKHQPGGQVNWVILVNSSNGATLSESAKSNFARLGSVGYFHHDNGGWDIGAYQAYSKVCKSDYLLMFGASSYFRVSGWIGLVTAACQKHGKNAVYGVCGNLGHPPSNVSPHIRTTGFWCSPTVLNKYPTVVRTADQRYPFEHGSKSFTVWAWEQGYQVLVVDAEKTYGYPHWNDGKNGYHMGGQSALLFGDRMTAPPFYHVE